MSGDRFRDGSLLARLTRFAAVGALGTLAHYALLLALVEGRVAPPVAASVAGFVLGALVNYTMSRRFVFRSERAHVEALPRFFAVAGVGAAGNALLMAVLAGWLGLHYLLAQVVTTGLLVLWHYAGNALWTFRRRRSVYPPAKT